MLEIVRYNEDEYEFPCLLVLGCFDGLHIGHAELLKKAKLQAKINGLDLGVMLFSEGKGGKQVFTFDERLKFLEQYNVKFVLKVEFTPEFKKTSPLDFLQNLEDKLNLKAYMSGKDFRFGEGKKGKSSTLKNYAEDEENGVWYMPVKDVTYGDGKVSTSAIKELIESGDITAANELLGRNFSVTAIAEEGTEGELTLIYPADKVEIKHGEYAVKCAVGESVYSGVASFGGNGNLEVRLENCNESLAGSELTVEFISGIGDAQKVDEAVEELAVTESEPAVEAAAAEEPVENNEFEEELNEEVEELPVETVVTVEEPATEEITVEETVEEVEPIAEEAPIEEIAEEPAEEISEPAWEEVPVAEEAPAEETLEEQEETVENSEDNGENGVD